MYLTQINSSKEPLQEKVKKLSTQTFKPLNIPICPIHESMLLPQQLICLKSTCPSYLSRFCSHCPHSKSHLHNINHTVPILSQYLQNNWQQIRKQNAQVQHEWKVCEYNIKYCIDILNQIHKLIKQSKQTRLYQLPIFQGILKQVMGMYRQGVTIQQVIKKFNLLNDKYGLFQTQNLKQNDKSNKKAQKMINNDSIQKDKQFRLNKWLKSGQQTKNFSQQALAFSQRLSQSIQNRLKYEKRKKNLQDLTLKKLNTLADIFQQYKNTKIQQQFYQKVQQIPSLTIQLPNTSKNTKNSQLQIQQQSFLTQNLTKFHNLTSIAIKNKNGKITGSLWQKLIKNFQYLKKLKQLRLHLRVQDLLLLTKLFSMRPHAVRHIPNLHLTITDEPKLDMKQVAAFCNTLQLKQLYLILTRDNISKNNYLQFINTLRFKTSLSYLPLDVLDINLTKNKIIDSIDIRECTNVFKDKYKEVKHSTIIF